MKKQNPMNIYLDHAASSPMFSEVFEAMTPYLRDLHGNPSSVHSFGRKLKVALENSRKKIASLINASPYEIIFTSGATEGNNWILRSAVKSLGIKNIITSPLEHNAVFNTVKDLAEEQNINVHYLSIDEKGNISLGELKKLLKELDKVLVSLMYVNNETGNIYNIKAIGEVCRKNNAYFHSDAVQGIGTFKMDMQKLPLDFFVVSAHKFGGPKGVGFAFKRENIDLLPLITGGSHEFKYRAGTENLAGIVGMAKALEITYAQLEEKNEHLRKIKEHFLSRLQNEVPNVQINGNPEYSVPAILNVSLPPVFSEEQMWMFALDMQGIAVSAGSACSSGTTKTSRVLGAMGLPPERLKHAVRFSFGPQTTLQEIDYTTEVIKKLAETSIV